MANGIARFLAWLGGRPVAGGTADGQDSYRGYETPAYTVEQRIDGAELRAYAPSLVAVVTVPGARDAALRAGFRILAGYIFGGNQGASKVAMTAPVAQAPAEKIAMTSPVAQKPDGDQWTVSFTMPQRYTRATLPTPTSGQIRFVEQPARRQIALRFSGRGTPGAIAAQTARLERIAAGAGLSLSGPAQTYFYDDPLTLPWNRRNEVAFDLV